MKMNSKTDSRKTRECPTITEIRVAMNPSRGPSTMPVIGLMMKTHPNQMPDEKPGVTIESRATDITANRAMRAVLRALDAWALDMANGFQGLAKLLKRVARQASGFCSERLTNPSGNHTTG